MPINFRFFPILKRHYLFIILLNEEKLIDIIQILVYFLQLVNRTKDFLSHTKEFC